MLEWVDPPPTIHVGMPRTDWAGFTVNGDNDLEARWLEIYAESGLDWSACGFWFNAGELRDCALIAHAARTFRMEINDDNMRELEALAGVEPASGGDEAGMH